MTNKLSTTVSTEMQDSSVLMTMDLGVTGIDLREVLRGIQRSAAFSVSMTSRENGSEQRPAEVKQPSRELFHEVMYLSPSFPSSFVLPPISLSFQLVSPGACCRER